MTYFEAIELRRQQLNGGEVPPVLAEQAIQVIKANAQTRPITRGQVKSAGRKFTGQGVPVKGRFAPVDNPWGLTGAQCEILRLVLLHGDQKKASAAFGIAVCTFKTHLQRAREKMGVSNTLQALLEWDRFNRGRSA